MVAQYPDAIYTPRTMANRTGVVYDALRTKDIYAEDFNKDRAEIVAIQTILGTTPQGAYATVKAWLTALGVAVGGIITTFLGLSDTPASYADQGGKVVAVNSAQDALEFIDVFNLLVDGWFPSGETWTYNAVNKFKVPTNLTTKYTKGTKIKLTNGGSVKYFYVISSSYSAPDTTVTLAGEVDLANSANTLTYLSYADCPRGFKRGQDWFRCKAHLSGNQSVTTGTQTKVELDVEDYDPNANFASYKYTAPVAGYYHIIASLGASSGATRIFPWPRKNGTAFMRGADNTVSAAYSSNISDIIYLAKGDYIELWGYCVDSSSPEFSSDQSMTYLSIQFCGV
ncbi:MAG: hypothetical protein WCX88_01800 [Patescibacteria group bacterium]